MRLSQNMTCMQAKPGLLKLIGWEREVPAWHAALTRALDNDTRLVGPAISCEGMHRGGDPDGEWRANPHVLSHAIAVEQVGRVLPGFVQVPVQGPCAASSPCMPKGWHTSTTLQCALKVVNASADITHPMPAWFATCSYSGCIDIQHRKRSRVEEAAVGGPLLVCKLAAACMADGTATVCVCQDGLRLLLAEGQRAEVPR